MKNLVLLAIIGLVPSAYAGKEAGNGADAVVCPNKIEILEVVEARDIRGIEFHWAAGTPQEKVEAALAPLQRLSSHRYQRLLEWTKSFMTEVVFSEIPLKDIPDSYEVFLPEGCAIQQAVIQSAAPGAPRYTINRKLWDRLDDDNRAALILHEITYREAIEEGHTNSIHVRYLASLLAGKRLDQMKQMEFYNLLRELKFDRLTYQGHEVSIARNCRFSDNHLASVKLPSVEVQVGKRRLVVNEVLYQDSGYIWRVYLPGSALMIVNGVRFETTGVLDFHPDGTLRDVELVEGSVVESKNYRVVTKESYHARELRFYPKSETVLSIPAQHGDFNLFGRTLRVGAEMNWNDGDSYNEHRQLIPTYFQFLENGQVLRVHIQESIVIESNGHQLALEAGRQVEFHPSGQVAVATLAKDSFVPFLGGNRKVSTVSYAQSGQLTSANLVDAIEATVQGKRIWIHELARVYPSGNLETARLAREVKLKTTDGKTKKFKPEKYGSLYFTEEGLVK